METMPVVLPVLPVLRGPHQEIGPSSFSTTRVFPVSSGAAEASRKLFSQLEIR